jgi:hypothetical protein
VPLHEQNLSVLRLDQDLQPDHSPMNAEDPDRIALIVDKVSMRNDRVRTTMRGIDKRIAMTRVIPAIREETRTGLGMEDGAREPAVDIEDKAGRVMLTGEFELRVVPHRGLCKGPIYVGEGVVLDACTV